MIPAFQVSRKLKTTLTNYFANTITSIFRLANNNKICIRSDKRPYL